MHKKSMEKVLLLFALRKFCLLLSWWNNVYREIDTSYFWYPWLRWSAQFV